MFSEILSNEKDSEFAISMVDLLNSILLTSTELFDLRNSLKDFNTPVIKTFIFLFNTFFLIFIYYPGKFLLICLFIQNMVS